MLHSKLEFLDLETDMDIFAYLFSKWTTDEIDTIAFVAYNYLPDTNAQHTWMTLVEDGKFLENEYNMWKNYEMVGFDMFKVCPYHVMLIKTKQQEYCKAWRIYCGINLTRVIDNFAYILHRDGGELTYESVEAYADMKELPEFKNSIGECRFIIPKELYE